MIIVRQFTKESCANHFGNGNGFGGLLWAVKQIPLQGGNTTCEMLVVDSRKDAIDKVEAGYSLFALSPAMFHCQVMLTDLTMESVPGKLEARVDMWLSLNTGEQEALGNTLLSLDNENGSKNEWDGADLARLVESRCTILLHDTLSKEMRKKENGKPVYNCSALTGSGLNEESLKAVDACVPEWAQPLQKHGRCVLFRYIEPDGETKGVSAFDERELTEMEKNYQRQVKELDDANRNTELALAKMIQSNNGLQRKLELEVQALEIERRRIRLEVEQKALAEEAKVETQKRMSEIEGQIRELNDQRRDLIWSKVRKEIFRWRRIMLELFFIILIGCLLGHWISNTLLPVRIQFVIDLREVKAEAREDVRRELRRLVENFLNDGETRTLVSLISKEPLLWQDLGDFRISDGNAIYQSRKSIAKLDNGLDQLAEKNRQLFTLSIKQPAYSFKDGTFYLKKKQYHLNAKDIEFVKLAFELRGGGTADVIAYLESIGSVSFKGGNAETKVAEVSVMEHRKKGVLEEIFKYCAENLGAKVDRNSYPVKISTATTSQENWKIRLTGLTTEQIAVVEKVFGENVNDIGELSLPLNRDDKRLKDPRLEEAGLRSFISSKLTIHFRLKVMFKGTVPAPILSEYLLDRKAEKDARTPSAWWVSPETKTALDRLTDTLQAVAGPIPTYTADILVRLDARKLSAANRSELLALFESVEGINVDALRPVLDGEVECYQVMKPFYLVMRKLDAAGFEYAKDENRFTFTTKKVLKSQQILVTGTIDSEVEALFQTCMRERVDNGVSFIFSYAETSDLNVFLKKLSSHPKLECIRLNPPEFKASRFAQLGVVIEGVIPPGYEQEEFFAQKVFRGSFLKKRYQKTETLPEGKGYRASFLYTTEDEKKEIVDELAGNDYIRSNFEGYYDLLLTLQVRLGRGGDYFTENERRLVFRTLERPVTDDNLLDIQMKSTELVKKLKALELEGISYVWNKEHLELMPAMRKYSVIVSARGSDNLDKMAKVLEGILASRSIKALDFETERRGSRVEMVLEARLPAAKMADEIWQGLNNERSNFTRQKDRFPLDNIKVEAIEK